MWGVKMKFLWQLFLFRLPFKSHLMCVRSWTIMNKAAFYLCKQALWEHTFSVIWMNAEECDHCHLVGHALLSKRHLEWLSHCILHTVVGIRSTSILCLVFFRGKVKFIGQILGRESKTVLEKEQVKYGVLYEHSPSRLIYLDVWSLVVGLFRKN